MKERSLKNDVERCLRNIPCDEGDYQDQDIRYMIAMTMVIGTQNTRGTMFERTFSQYVVQAAPYFLEKKHF